MIACDVSPVAMFYLSATCTRIVGFTGCVFWGVLYLCPITFVPCNLSFFAVGLIEQIKSPLLQHVYFCEFVYLCIICIPRCLPSSLFLCLFAEDSSTTMACVSRPMHLLSKRPHKTNKCQCLQNGFSISCIT